MSGTADERVAMMAQHLPREDDEAAPAPAPAAEDPPEEADVAEAGAEDEDGEAEHDAAGKQKLSGHQRQKLKLQKLEAENKEIRTVVEKMHREALAVLEDNENLAGQLEDARAEIAALLNQAKQYGLDESELRLDPREAENRALKRQLEKIQGQKQRDAEQAKARQRNAIRAQLEETAAKHGITPAALAKAVLAYGGEKTPEEVAAEMASVRQARKEATERVGRPGQKSSLRSEGRGPVKSDSYEERVSAMTSWMEG